MSRLYQENKDSAEIYAKTWSSCPNGLGELNTRKLMMWKSNINCLLLWKISSNLHNVVTDYGTGQAKKSIFPPKYWCPSWICINALKNLVFDKINNFVGTSLTLMNLKSSYIQNYTDKIEDKEQPNQRVEAWLKSTVESPIPKVIQINSWLSSYFHFSKNKHFLYGKQCCRIKSTPFT